MNCFLEQMEAVASPSYCPFLPPQAPLNKKQNKTKTKQNAKQNKTKQDKKQNKTEQIITKQN